MPVVSPPLREYPTKLFVEVSSRCNLNCRMCMKQAHGQPQPDGDLSPATFDALTPALPQLDALVLNGIGEPLLNRHLEQFIRRARQLMPSHGWIGFQSNGMLLNNLRAISLVDAGLDRICLSMDGVTPDTFRNVRTGSELANLERALDVLVSVRSICNRPDLAIGVEFVVMRDNLRELPAALRWAARRNVSFAIVSHLLPYDEPQAAQCAYGLCTDEALALFHAWKDKADLAGIRIERYFELLWRYDRTAGEQRIIAFVESMKAEALRRGVSLDLKRLFEFDLRHHHELAEVFAQAREVAEETGIQLLLPALSPRERRSCAFVQEGGAFVSWNGQVHPCYYLWHHCRSYAGGWLQPVTPRVFGDLAESDLLEIWNSPPFRRYRENVLRPDYPFCPGCSTAPCDYIQAEPFTQDCYINTEPCGGCLWSAGMFHCLS